LSKATPLTFDVGDPAAAVAAAASIADKEGLTVASGGSAVLAAKTMEAPARSERAIKDFMFTDAQQERGKITRARSGSYKQAWEKFG
jgi:hypothetical protein